MRRVGRLLTSLLDGKSGKGRVECGVGVAALQKFDHMRAESVGFRHKFYYRASGLGAVVSTQHKRTTVLPAPGAADPTEQHGRNEGAGGLTTCRRIPSCPTGGKPQTGGVEAFEAGWKADCSQDWLPHENRRGLRSLEVLVVQAAGQIFARCDELCGVNTRSGGFNRIQQECRTARGAGKIECGHYNRNVICTAVRLAPLFFAAYQITLAAGVEFNRDIRPILSDKCFACHGPDAANRKTKMRFDIESGARIAIAPGDPAKSDIVRRITSEDTAVRMPPAYAGREKLSGREIGLIRQWIEQGAPWQKHWSFIAPVRPAGSGIDAFIAARLEREGLHPSAEADRRILIRRVTFDLTGLPPSPAEVDAFVSDAAPEAYERVVDRLLASPRYGERMAFQWLEAARYADTNGYQTDGVREMWRWRDWVIDAFNRNMPYDQFTVEQIAGDLLPNPTLDQRIATAFHRNHRTSAEGGIVPEEYRVEYVADRAETTATVWMGLTLGCARCHDHKFEPFSQADFYRLFAYFNNVPEKGLVYNYGNEEPYIKAPTPDQERRVGEMDERIAAAERRYDALHPELEEAQRRWERKRTLGRESEADWTVTDGLVFLQSAKNAPDAAPLEYLDPFTFSAWIKPDSLDGAILSRGEDYFEGQGHYLYLIDGKVRLHMTRRFADIGLRMETVSPVRLGEWQHVVVTYDGKRRGKGVRIYLDGAPQETKILFDELEAPLSIDKTIPFRIGAGGGRKFSGAIEDVRVYKVALSPEQAGIVGVKKPIGEIAAIPAERRSKAESDKLAACFLEKYAPTGVRSARLELVSLRRERELFYASIPTVMVMAESAKPRDTFVLKRGVYDNPGEKVTAGVPSILLHAAGGVAGEPAGASALAHGPVESTHGASDCEPLLANVFRHRHRENGERLRVAGRVAGPPGIAGLAGDGVHGQRVEREGAAEDDRDERDVPAVFEDDARAAAERPGKPAAGARAEDALRAGDNSRSGAGAVGPVGGEGRRAVGEALSAGGAVAGIGRRQRVRPG